MASPKQPSRTVKTKQDLGSIPAIKYNDAAGADKIVIVEPVVKRAVAGGEAVGAGKYVKVTGAAYTLDLIGRAYAVATIYQKGDVVSNGADIYMALQDGITGAFDATKWRRVAPKAVGPVAIAAGSVVCTGRWHNSVTEAGFLVDDDSDITHARSRD